MLHFAGRYTFSRSFEPTTSSDRKHSLSSFMSSPALEHDAPCLNQLRISAAFMTRDFRSTEIRLLKVRLSSRDEKRLLSAVEAANLKVHPSQKPPVRKKSSFENPLEGAFAELPKAYEPTEPELPSATTAGNYFVVMSQLNSLLPAFTSTVISAFSEARVLYLAGIASGFSSSPLE